MTTFTDLEIELTIFSGSAAGPGAGGFSEVSSAVSTCRWR